MNISFNGSFALINILTSIALAIAFSLPWIVVFGYQRRVQRYEIEIAKLCAEKIRLQIGIIHATAAQAAHIKSILNYVGTYRRALLCIRDNELSAEGCQAVARNALVEVFENKQKTTLPTGSQ